MSRPILELDGVTKRFGATVASDNLSLSVRPGEFFTLLGPSGSGKSTILRIVAGLERPDAGRILIAGQDMANVPPWHRNLGMMFQSYAVFPHMTVGQNVAYGLKVRGKPTEEARRRIDQMLELVGLAQMSGKNVTVLSGGEQQRVALARALAPEPRMLLLDEPLSALDEKIRRAMQIEIKHVHRKTGTTFLYVTHDQEEALTMSDRIAVFDRGRCVQCDAPRRLYRRPRTRFVAGFFRGCNVLRAEPVTRADGYATYRLAGAVIEQVPSDGAPAAGDGHIAIRAESVEVGPSAAASSCRFNATLVETTYRGTVVDYLLQLPDGQELTATTTRYEEIKAGSAVVIGFEPRAVIPLED